MPERGFNGVSGIFFLLFCTMALLKLILDFFSIHDIIKAQIVSLN